MRHSAGGAAVVLRRLALVGALSLAGAAVVATAPGEIVSEAAPYPAIGAIERLDPGLDALVPKDARMERLATGFEWSEGPVWQRETGSLLFSDVLENVVYRWKDGAGVTPFLRPSGYTGRAPRAGETGSNGLAFDPLGRLVLCQHGDRRVARLERDGSFTTLADRFQGKRFNSPNDLAFRANGDLYFTDPPYGLPEQADDPERELAFSGVYRLSKAGEVTLLVRDLTRPNGLAFSPDERTLYVAVSDPARPVWMAYDVKADGSLAGGRVFFDAAHLRAQGRKGLPDGLEVDVAGNLFATGPGGVLLLSPQGRHLGTLVTGEATANCAFGDDGRTLYATADMHLVRVRLTTRGRGF
jgi:gluconolactonase